MEHLTPNCRCVLIPVSTKELDMSIAEKLEEALKLYNDAKIGEAASLLSRVAYDLRQEEKSKKGTVSPNTLVSGLTAYGISHQTAYALRCHGLTTWEEVAAQSDADLLRIPGLGQKGLLAVQKLRGG